MYKIKTFTFKQDILHCGILAKNILKRLAFRLVDLLSKQAFIIALLYEMPTHMRA